MSNNKQVLADLIAKGYRETKSRTVNTLFDAQWSVYKRWDGKEVQECVCNESQPQIGIYFQSFKYPTSDEVHENYVIEVTQENQLGWVTLKYYGISEDYIVEELQKYEQSLMNAWESTWDEKPNY